MKYLSAYCLVALSGKSVSAAEVKKVLESVGAKIDETKLNKVVDSLKDKALHEVIAAGLPKVSSMGGSAGPAAGGSAPAKEEKKEVKVEEEEESEEDMDMGGLFD